MIYYFECEGHKLSPITADSKENAYKQLKEQHKWIKANKNNSVLIKIKKND